MPVIQGQEGLAARMQAADVCARAAWARDRPIRGFTLFHVSGGSPAMSFKGEHMIRRKLSALAAVSAAVGLASLLMAGVAAGRQGAAGAEKELRAQADLFAAGWNHGDA
jgi:hypothetical protein